MEPLFSAVSLASPLISHPSLFRIGDFGTGNISAGNGAAFCSGFELLNGELAGRGWAKPGITEILCNHVGIGELSLLMKALGSAKNVVRPGEAMHMLWVVPDTQAWIPYAPALAQSGINLDHLAIVRTNSSGDALWVAEQGLKSGACRAVLLRMNEAWCNPLSLRRLQQAAMAGNSILWLMRPVEAAASPSPAGTRIVLQPEGDGALRLDLRKRRGLPAGKSIRLFTRTLTCLTRKPRYVRAPLRTSSISWLDQVVAEATSRTEQNPPGVRQRSFNRERG